MFQEHVQRCIDTLSLSPLEGWTPNTSETPDEAVPDTPGGDALFWRSNLF
jgi:hypothetical protein